MRTAARGIAPLWEAGRLFTILRWAEMKLTTTPLNVPVG